MFSVMIYESSLPTQKIKEYENKYPTMQRARFYASLTLFIFLIGGAFSVVYTFDFKNFLITGVFAVVVEMITLIALKIRTPRTPRPPDSGRWVKA